MIDNFDSVNSGNIGNEELPNLNLGSYTALRVEKIRMFAGTKPGKTHIQYFKCVFTVLNNENGHNAGDTAQMFESVSGGAYPHFDQQAQSRVKKLLGAIAGIASDAEITSKVTSKDLALATSDAQPFKGSVVAAVVSGKDPRFPKVVCSPAADIATRPTLPTPPVAAPAALERFPHPAMPGHTYDATGAIFDATGKRVN